MPRMNVISSKSKKIIQIIVTEQCNLNCVYCYEKNKPNAVMPENRIKSIFESSFANTAGYDGIEFDFHGGEIALCFPVLKEACEWLWSRQWGIPFLCFASTNGTLIHDDIQQWFWKNRKRIWLGLSLDGTPEMHNINRSNSFSSIDIDFFRRAWPDQSIKMTISPQTINSVAEGVRFIHEMGFNLTANLAYGVNWSEPSQIKEYEAQLLLLVQYYLKNHHIKPANVVSFPLAKIGASVLLSNRVGSSRWCGCGKEMVCYDVDGRSYPCQFFVPSTLAKNGDRVLFSTDFLDDSLFDDPMCALCVLRYACPTCYGSNYVERGDIKKRCRNLCHMRKIEALASSYLYGMMLLDKDKYFNELSASEEALIIAGINEVQREFAYK